ncbi:hypothetical protein GCK32_011384 [Trichostrongylus colubriformis]|uniref:Uncharacterized protein n=1 Tax=Trichostrongylus colubriformis TaxID=6319 RepID=A0AAN8ICB5_TRICO
MFFTWIPFLLATAVVITNAVPLNLVRIACAQNPQLAFCDSHILGLPAGAIQPSATSTSTAASPIKGVTDYSGNDDFVRWLNEQDDEVTIDEREHHPKLSDKKEYCAKYKANFGNYCKTGIEGKLDGILPQFCAVYIKQCKGDGSEFPRPGPLPETGPSPKMMEETDETPMKAAAAEVPTKVVAELPPHAAQETAMIAETEGFKDGVLQYCEKFADKYKHFCQGAQRSELGKTNEFCSSYRDSCHHTEPSATSKVPAEVAPPETEQATGSVEAPMEAAAAEVPTKVVAELPPHAAQETAMIAETEGFKDGVLQYCEKFADQYNHFCQGAQRSELGKTDEFCSSYRDSCHHTKPSATSKVPAEVAPPETEQATGSSGGAAPVPTAPKTSEPSSASKTPESPKKPSGSDIDDVEEFPESAEVGAGSQSSFEEEKPGKGPEKDPKVQKYCDEFWENYNYYCAGDQSTGHEKFCRSYRTNCPHKLSS